MTSEKALKSFVAGTIRAEKARQSLTWEDLSKKLKALGIRQSPSNLSTKVARGGMSAHLFFALMLVLGKSRIDTSEIELAPARKK